MDTDNCTDAESFQRFLTQQLRRGGRDKSPEELLRAWRFQKRNRQKRAARIIKTTGTRDVSTTPAGGSSQLGKRLREIRGRYIARGGELLTPEQVDREVAERFAPDMPPPLTE